MRLLGNIRVTRTLRRLRSFVRPGIAILGYHRLHDEQDPLYLSVSPRRFEEHLRVIAKKAAVLSLRDAAHALATNIGKKRGIVITFDDGYSDNLHLALPLLEKYGVPATVFVTSGNRGGEFWWDRLARLGEIDDDLEATAAQLERLDDEAREMALRELEQHRTPVPAEPIHRSLTAEELKQLAASPLIEIGAHTVSHHALPTLEPDHQLAEIAGSRTQLETLLRQRVTSFAYPHGALTLETAAHVAAAGFEVACCSQVDVATLASPALQLPRLWVADHDGAPFERWLRGWLHA